MKKSVIEKNVESTVKENILCCQCENPSEGTWLQIRVDFEFTKSIIHVMNIS